MLFRDRSEAGRLLADRLSEHEKLAPIVIALRPSSLPVATEVARALGAPLQLWGSDLRPARPVQGRNVLLVDDGLAAGRMVVQAVRALQRGKARQITLAVPVCDPRGAEAIRRVGGLREVICLREPQPFRSVGTWYEFFDDVSEGDVQELLEEARRRERRAA